MRIRSRFRVSTVPKPNHERIETVTEGNGRYYIYVRASPPMNDPINPLHFYGGRRTKQVQGVT